jgi:hypothetical protein
MSVQNLDRLLENLPIVPSDNRTFGNVAGSDRALVKISNAALSGTADAYLGVYINPTNNQSIWYQANSSGNWTAI